MASRKYIEERRRKARARGLKGVEARRRKMLEERDRVWELVRVIEMRRADGSVSGTWRVFATGDPDAPLSVDFGNELHRYMSPRRLAPLIAKKMFAVVH